MARVILNYANRILFKIRWLTMSDKERYIYHWDRTRNSLKAEVSELSLRRSKGVVSAMGTWIVKPLDKTDAYNNAGSGKDVACPRNRIFCLSVGGD